MKTWLIAFALATVTTLASAQQTPPPKAVDSAAVAPVITTQVSPPPAPAATGHGKGSQPDEAALTKSLTGLESAVARIEGKLPSAWWTTPLTTLISVLIGGLITGGIGYFMQARLLEHQDQQAAKRAILDENLADKKANHEVRQTLFDWRVRQFMELYGPLRALFDGSNEVYRRMNEALISQDPNRFRDLTLSGEADQLKEVDPDGRFFEIYDETTGAWRKFRTIMDWSIVYGRGLGVDGYFDRIVDIGSSISKLIGEKAGLVMPHHAELLASFGKYLAHFEVLKELHAGAQEPQDEAKVAIGAPLKVREAAAFPNSIQRLVRAGADELLAELAKPSVAQPTA
ncbi:hypothetical protein [Methylibium petroleiphilum]|uniref:hypothetical protein n=1 Tax=Methylibium petroleiphilum TaxID=105560 RepID=UPI0011D0C326|nr:hypothetical protein [Methylibium petroleiphilum]